MLYALQFMIYVVSVIYATTLCSVKYIVRNICEYMGPGRDMVEMSSIEVKYGDIPEGKSVTFEWRGKPLFVRHRDAAEIAREQAVSLSELRDPQTDAVSLCPKIIDRRSF